MSCVLFLNPFVKGAKMAGLEEKVRQNGFSQGDFLGLSLKKWGNPTNPSLASNLTMGTCRGGRIVGKAEKRKEAWE